PPPPPPAPSFFFNLHTPFDIMPSLVCSDKIYLKKSKAFPFVLVTLLLFRTVLKVFLGNSVDPGELAGMFFLLAFSMLVPWRLAMLYRYKKIKDQIVA
ncbi:DUF1453 family protein, partial [Staphylococcus pseudintermedius]|uniref:CcdC protein domain-containing protein n=1 Tax=Staphylococcus pseudintermedius TaxID=283734 RepID=UPI0022E9E47E